MHLFWEEALDPDIPAGTVIYYRRWSSDGWSEAVDLLMSPEGAKSYAIGPDVALGPDDRLYVAWRGGWGGTVYVSSADALQAGNAHSWSNPVEAGIGSQVSAPSMAFDQDGVLHLVFLVPLGSDRGVYHTTFDDLGRSWSLQGLIPGSPGPDDVFMANPILTVTDSGTVIVAWSVSGKTQYDPRSVQFTRTTDGGKSWAEIREIPGPFGEPGLASFGPRGVHLVFSGTKHQRQKFHSWSGDGGETWSPYQPILGLGGYQGYSSMAQDSAGVVHLALVGTHPELVDSLFHATWQGQAWIGPELVMADPKVGTNMGNASMVVTHGNRLHIAVGVPVLVAGELKNDIFYAQGAALAPALTYEPTPAFSSAPMQASTRTANGVADETIVPKDASVARSPSPTAAAPYPLSAARPTNTASAVLIGVVLSGVLVGGVVTATLLRLRRRM